MEKKKAGGISFEIKRNHRKDWRANRKNGTCILVNAYDGIDDTIFSEKI